jgi:uncharacterized membrane protein
MKLTALTFTTLALIAVSIVVGAVSYDRLPDRIPTHFDLHGHPNGYTAKPLGVFLTPLILAFTGLLFLALPRISPKGYRLEPFLRTYEVIAIAVLVFEFADVMLTLYAAAGHPLDFNRVVIVGIGLLFIVLGNFLGKVTRNFFVGIRTPWTLASDEVWLRTHRLGGVLFVIGGAIVLVAGLAGSAQAPYVLAGVVTVIVLYLIVYSYVVYRRIEHGG